MSPSACSSQTSRVVLSDFCLAIFHTVDLPETTSSLESGSSCCSSLCVDSTIMPWFLSLALVLTTSSLVLPLSTGALRLRFSRTPSVALPSVACARNCARIWPLPFSYDDAAQIGEDVLVSTGHAVRDGLENLKYATRHVAYPVKEAAIYSYDRLPENCVACGGRGKRICCGLRWKDGHRAGVVRDPTYSIANNVRSGDKQYKDLLAPRFFYDEDAEQRYRARHRLEPRVARGREAGSRSSPVGVHGRRSPREESSRSPSLGAMSRRSFENLSERGSGSWGEDVEATPRGKLCRRTLRDDAGAHGAANPMMEAGDFATRRVFRSSARQVLDADNPLLVPPFPEYRQRRSPHEEFAVGRSVHRAAATDAGLAFSPAGSEAHEPAARSLHENSYGPQTPVGEIRNSLGLIFPFAHALQPARRFD